MEGQAYIQHQVAAVRRLADAALKDMTEEQVNWFPPGMANSIGTILLHAFTSEDRHFQTILQGKPRLWETEGWGERAGVTNPPGGGRNWEEVKTQTFSLAFLLEYHQAVKAATDAYLSNLSPAELDRTVNYIRGEQPVADVVAAFLVHMTGHMGEVAALRGIQGVKGLPF
ncbi:MAG: DinB family protein [Chloroflexi bacterium]|nr:DinB family protein [Chloroflexota bacterium]